MPNTAKNHIARVAAAVIVAAGLAFGASGAAAKEYKVVNQPPPMPEEMKNGAATRGGQSFNAVSITAKREARLGEKEITVRESTIGDVGFAVPDSEGGLVWIPADVRRAQAGMADARELKLKVRELASQLIAGMDPALRGMVAIPTSFVSQEDFTQTSPLGRFMAEQLIYEFNQRGFPIREYRLAGSVSVRDDGEFMLSRKVSGVSANATGTLFVVGTYFADRQAVFINARLVRGNGSVLRTAQIVLPSSSMTRRMLAGGGGAGKMLRTGSLPIHDFKTTTQPTNLTPFDLGEDVH
ncbi:MAG: hypothetical protein DELT_00888 [Desulfovibrio sp.]